MNRSCLVLSCLVLSCLVLSCLVLSCLVLSCLVLSCLVLSCLVYWPTLLVESNGHYYWDFHQSCIYLKTGVGICTVLMVDAVTAGKVNNYFDWANFLCHHIRYSVNSFIEHNSSLCCGAALTAFPHFVIHI